VPFQGRPPGAPPGSRDERPGTFDFLGFTHYWGRTLKGNWAVKRKTSQGRFRRSLASVAQWCREHRHLPITEQWGTLTRKLRGHFAYYGIAGNLASLGRFRYHVTRAWHKWLSRRSGKARIPWERFGEVERRYPLPPARLRGHRQVTQRIHGTRSRMPSRGTSGSVGGRGGKLPRPTRPRWLRSTTPLRFHTPLVEPDVQISRIRLSDKADSITGFPRRRVRRLAYAGMASLPRRPSP